MTRPGRVLVIAVLIGLSLAGCGKRSTPVPPPGEPDEYPGTYPHVPRPTPSPTPTPAP